MQFQTASQVIKWIHELTTLGIRPGLTRIGWVLEQLDYPEKKLQFIHVAGTNGKGSTCAFLTHILQALGKKTATFTSPYLEYFTDRIRIENQNMPDEDLVDTANLLYPLCQTPDGPLTMFEVTTALALVYFSSKEPDYVIWETGLGGRNDVTNIVTPLVSIITNIGHDHMDLLGGTLEKVAFEKAGIIKRGIPIVTTEKKSECLEIIRQEAAQKQAPIFVMGEAFSYRKEDNQGTFTYESEFNFFSYLKASLYGEHQIQNASAAIAALQRLQLTLPFEKIKKGLENTQWPGRLEIIQSMPLILLDGAHNPEAAHVLVNALTDHFTYNQLHMVIGMVERKDHYETLKPFMEIADTIIFTEPDIKRAFSATDLAKIGRSFFKDVNIIVESNWKKAYEQLSKKIGYTDIGIVAGSLYLISDVRAFLKTNTKPDKGW